MFHLASIISALRGLTHSGQEVQESGLNDSLLDLWAELETLSTRLNEFYENATLKWQECVPDPPESIEL